MIALSVINVFLAMVLTKQILSARKLFYVLQGDTVRKVFRTTGVDVFSTMVSIVVVIINLCGREIPDELYAITLAWVLGIAALYGALWGKALADPRSTQKVKEEIERQAQKMTLKHLRSLKTRLMRGSYYFLTKAMPSAILLVMVCY